MSHWRQHWRVAPARAFHRAARRPAYLRPRLLDCAAVALWLGIIAAWLFLAMTFMARAHHSEHHNWLLSWIASSCCVTNDCCFEIAERDVVDLGNNKLRIVASGQVVERKGFSPDGKYYRCACDLNDGKWVVHPTAHTRCLFTPMQGS